MSGTKKLSPDTAYILRLALTLLAITAVTALLLGLVNYITSPIIEERNLKKQQEAMAAVLPADSYEAVEGFVPTGQVTALYEAATGGQVSGYVAEVTSNGFGGAMSVTVGINAAGAVSGVVVTGHEETPNVGSKVVDSPEGLAQFIGLSGTITVNTGENKIDAVSGATVSTNGVTDAVNAALAAAAPYLG